MSDNKKFVFEKLEKLRTEALTRKTFSILKDLMESPDVDAAAQDVASLKNQITAQEIQLKSITDPDKKDFAMGNLSMLKNKLSKAQGNLDGRKMNTYKEAYDSVRADGYAAREAGQPISSNPHKVGTPESKVWKNAWEQAHDDAKQDADDSFYEDASPTNPEIETLKKDIKDHEDRMKNSAESDDFYHSNGKHDQDQAALFGLKKRLKELQAKDQTDKAQEKGSVTEAAKVKDLTKESANKGPKKVKLKKQRAKRRLAVIYKGK